VFNDDVPVKHAYKTLLPIVSLLFWMSGCATQADLQTEQKAREALRSQVVADNRASLDEMRREIQKVRGEVEEIRYRLDRASKERIGTGPQLKVLEDRIAVLEKQFKSRLEERPPTISFPASSDTSFPQSSTEMLPGQVPTEAPGSTPGSPSSTQSNNLTGSKEELALAREAPEIQDEYKIGLRAFQAQQFDNAIQQFRSFQRKYPNSEMADDAQYWIGESYFNQRDYNRAILEFNDVLKYRKGDRVPAALLRQAQAFLEIGDKTDARLILQKLLNDHPNSEQAQEAKARLQVLGR
jgi:tol-pal system protein YbgF